MLRSVKSFLFTLSMVVLAVSAWVMAPAGKADPSDSLPFTLVVMDPMALPLACDCVEGYAQRKYEVLGEYLEKKLGRKVEVLFSEALKPAIKKDAKNGADLIIGKHSVVLSDANKCRMDLTPLFRLTDKEGLTTQTGLIVVRKDDPAQKIEDLTKYRILFGPDDSEEKHQAAVALLKKAGIAIPKKIETSPACSTAAGLLVDLKPDVRCAAVISSYAKPLLEGCGTVKKDDLRIIGETDPVPFVTAFVSSRVKPEELAKLRKALSDLKSDAALCEALETKNGFVPMEDSKEDKTDDKKKAR